MRIMWYGEDYGMRRNVVKGGIRYWEDCAMRRMLYGEECIMRIIWYGEESGMRRNVAWGRKDCDIMRKKMVLG